MIRNKTSAARLTQKQNRQQRYPLGKQHYMLTNNKFIQRDITWKTALFKFFYEYSVF